MSDDRRFDVIVVGSGAAGLSAAIAASAAGASVAVLEASDKFGGTTAMSGGVAWIPCNPMMAEVGASDSRERALEYLGSLSLGRADPTMLEAFVDAGPDVVRFLAERTPLDLHALKFPDYHPEFAGGGFGRSLMSDVVDAGMLGEYRPKLRTSPHFPVPISLLDMERAGVGGALADMDAILPTEQLMARMTTDRVAAGTALVAGLLKAAIDQGVTLLTDARVVRLIVEDNVVTGLSATVDDAVTTFEARLGVILASGGFERDPDLVRDFLRGPMEAPIGASECRGDGLVMAMEAGAAIGNMSEAWWQPVMRIPGEEFEGAPFYRLCTNERAMPGAILVNKLGRRFVNEAHNYNDIGRSFHAFDPVRFDFVNHPAWIVLHQGRLDRSAFLTRFPSDPIPNWLVSAPTIRDLAVAIEVDPDVLEETVERFNANARAGVDPDFQRGASTYDFFHGDAERTGAHQTLGPLDQPPYYAMRVYSGTLGTKGGPKTNARAEVLNPRGGVIAGLYAAGNAMAGVTGMAYPGAGGTIGPALVFGHIAGHNAATRRNRH